MKKEYMTPYVLVTAIELQKMIAASTLDSSSDAPSVEVSSSGYSGTFSARGTNGVWGDDEE